MHFLRCAHSGAALVCHMGFLDLECLGVGAAGPAMRVPPTHGITVDAQIGTPCILCLPLVFGVKPLLSDGCVGPAVL